MGLLNMWLVFNFDFFNVFGSLWVIWWVFYLKISFVYKFYCILFVLSFNNFLSLLLFILSNNLIYK